MRVDRTICVPMAPHAKQRARTTKTHTYTPDATKDWEQAFAWHAKAILGNTYIDEPVRVDIVFALKRPQKIPKSAPRGLTWAPVRPDRDNLEKAVLDALKGHWRDDSLVVAGETLKCYAGVNQAPFVWVRIRSVELDAQAEWERLGR